MKRVITLSFLLTVFFAYTVIAQELGSIRKAHEIKIPEKIHKLVLDPLPAGTYSIGTGGYFPTIDSAFNKLSIDGIAGEVTLELTDALYTAPSLSSFILNGPIPGAGTSSRVTIQPADNVAVTIEGDGEAVLMFFDASYVTLDGISLQGNTHLKVHALYNAQPQWNDAIDFYGNCDYVQVQNLTAYSDDVTRASAAIFFSNIQSAIPNSCIISGVSVTSATFGIYVAGQTGFRPSGFEIRNNHIGSPTDSLIAWGIQNELSDGTIIENNEVENIRRGYFTSASQYFLYGINAYFSNNVIIRNNIVHNIRATENNTRSQGILISGDASERGNNVWVYNNMVYDIRGYASQNVGLSGIRAWDQDNLRIEYNSVSLSEVGDVAPVTGSAALWFESSNNSPSAYNNILVNTRNDSPYTSTSIRFDGATGISDFNDLLVGPFDNSYIGKFSGTNYKTLADWQATGKDLNSISEMPYFISSSDLHIDKTFPTNLERGATPIAGITNDFDGDLRNTTTPDIGADEFDGFTLEDPLPTGTYTIGTGGNFETIQSAFDKLETDGIAGAVTFELIDNLYTAPADTFGFLLDGPIIGAGPNSRITIRPADNRHVIAEGNWRYVFTFRNVSYLTLDGISIDRPLLPTFTIHSLYNSQYETNRGIIFWDNADHNIAKNLTVICDDIMRDGIGIFFVAGVNSIVAPDSNLIEGNFIKKAGAAIVVGGYFSASTTRPTGNIVRKNIIGSETDSLIAWGIQLEKCHNTIVEDNIVQNLTVNNGYAWENINTGINSYWGSGDIIRNNVVHKIKASGGYTSVGILLSGDVGNTGSDNLVYNNMVYDIQSTSTQGDSRVAGIQMWQQNNPKIYYNSVNLFGTGANHYGSGALYIWNNCSNVEAKNNILVNTRDESPYCASSIYLQSTNALLNSDYNDLSYEASQYNYLVKSYSGSYSTLADWQVTGKDLHSYVEMPNFVDPYLHIDDTIATYIESRGIPIPGIDTDFDGDARHATTPDIGADELDGVVGVEDEITLPTEFALEQNYPNPFNPSTTFRYSIPAQSKVVIKVYDILGNEIATLMDEEKSIGTYELTWNAENLPSGVYFYQLRSGSFVETKKMLLLK